MMRNIALAALVASGLGTMLGTTAYAMPRYPAVHTAPCAYPDGWNLGDYKREEAGIPKGVNHQCVVNAKGQLLDSDGQVTN